MKMSSHLLTQSPAQPTVADLFLDLPPDPPLGHSATFHGFPAMAHEIPSAQHSSQIDYVLTRTTDIHTHLDCKVIPWEVCGGLEA